MADSYSDFEAVEEPDESAAETKRLRSRPESMLTQTLLGVGDTIRGSKNALNRALRGVTGGRFGELEQVVPEGKQAGDYVGEIATDVALSAAPVGGAVKAASMLPKAAGRFARLPTSIAANAGYSAATTEGDLEERGKAAMVGGAGAAGGHLLASTLGKLGRPVSTSPITQTMLDEGIELTPGQAGGRLHKALEGMLYNTPFMPGVRKAVGTAQKAGQEQAEDFLTDAGRIAANPKAHGLTDAQAEAWIKGAENINDVGTSTVPLSAIAAIMHIKTGGTTFAALSALYGTKLGRSVLLGQTSIQEALQKAPELAPHIAQITRATATQSGEQE